MLYTVMCMVSFSGYVLPNSNLAYHALCVIFSIVTVFPYFGYDVLYALYGARSPHASMVIMVRIWLLHTVSASLLLILV